MILILILMHRRRQIGAHISLVTPSVCTGAALPFCESHSARAISTNTLRKERERRARARMLGSRSSRSSVLTDRVRECKRRPSDDETIDRPTRYISLDFASYSVLVFLSMGLDRGHHMSERCARPCSGCTRAKQYPCENDRHCDDRVVRLHCDGNGTGVSGADNLHPLNCCCHVDH